MNLQIWIFVLATSLALVNSLPQKMDTVYEWNYIDYVWNSEYEKQEALKNGGYNFGNVLPMDVDVSKDGRVFITLLGSKAVPATLGTVSDIKGPSGPLIKPYPDWSWFKKEENKDNCDSILNVYRIAIDECNRLWVLDTGFLEGEIIKCEPQLLVFDLYTDKLINRVKIPNHIARSNGGNGTTLPANPIVETSLDSCDEFTVYIADVFGEGLIVYDGSRLYRLESPMFHQNINAQEVHVGSLSVNFSAGVCGMDLSPKVFPSETRFLYFRPLSSYGLFATSTNTLRKSNSGDNVTFFGSDNVLSSQAIAHAFSSEGTLFLGMTKELGLTCWNRYRDLKRENFELVVQDTERLQYPNGVKVIPPRDSNPEEEVWVLSNKFVAFQLGQLSDTDFNFRVMKKSVNELIRGTICEMPRETRIALQEVNNKSGSVLIVSD